MSCQYYNVLFVTLVALFYFGFFWAMPLVFGQKLSGVLMVHGAAAGAAVVVGLCYLLLFVLERSCF